MGDTLGGVIDPLLRARGGISYSVLTRGARSPSSPRTRRYFRVGGEREKGTHSSPRTRRYFPQLGLVPSRATLFSAHAEVFPRLLL